MPDKQPPLDYQARVHEWMIACFGKAISADKPERNHRFLEEALELVQANGCSASEAHQLVDYVFKRPIGEVRQEIGGVMVTLAALCGAIGESMTDASEQELSRVWTKIEKIRAKQAVKPKHSPLPEGEATPNNHDLIERAAIAARTAFENVAPESGAAEWALFKEALAASPLEAFDHRVDYAEEISCWTRVASAVLAVQNGEIERLRQALGAMTADMLGMRDGALVRDQAAEIERLRAEHDAAWQPIETAPTDGTTVLVFAPAYDAGLPEFQCTAAYHPDGGWCVDELREPTHWRPLPHPPGDPA